jgi:hypothetical protein
MACQLIPAPRGQLLGIGQAFDVIVEAQNHSSSHNGTRKWSAPCLIDSGDESA